MKCDAFTLPLDLGSELIIDNFAGGGGASTGLERAFGRPVDVAINHDPEALAMHAANHPHTAHYCESVFDVDPIAITGNQPVALVWLSPDCKHFSKAKGGQPVSKKIRGLAWIALRWAAKVKPRVIMLENVEEFQTWGPLAADGKPCPKRKGRTFRSFVNALRAQGYVVEWRELRACDYGAPTIRKRLFLVARRDHLPIVWPAPTHGDPKSAAVRSGKLLPWRTAAECIDWSIPCPSIFERARPLKDATLRRIAKGIMKFVVNSADPFIVKFSENSVGQLLDEPLHTVMAGAPRFGIVAPTLMHVTHHGADRIADISVPLATVTGAHRGEQALVAATLIQTGYGERGGQSPRVPGLDKPLGTAVAGGVKHAVVSAFLAKHFTGVTGTRVDVPTGTVTTTDHHSVVTAQLVGCGGRAGQSRPRDVSEPHATITAKADTTIAVSHLVKLRNNQFGQDVRDPAPTLTAGGGHVGEVRAFLIKYYGNEKDGVDLREPMHTIPTHDRFGLVTVNGEDYAIVDIGMRMLTPRELARAQGFPDSYVLDPVANGKPLSKSAQVRMIGNSVCPDLSTALAVANFAHERALQQVAV
jgi:DNA (cytosine-5)-methyltransferase 1